MALHLVTPSEDQPIPSVAAVVPLQPVVLTSAEITGLIGLFQTMLDRTERNILDRLDDNSRGAAARWAKHDEELATNTRRVVERFEKVEAAIVTTTEALRAHLDREHDEHVRMDARLSPIRGSVAWLWDQRRDIVILLIGLGVLATFVVEAFGRVLGPHAP
jgi:hypothetical protein